MCIYCGTTKYRKIYENHYGAIPREDNGRTYDVHHIDGNRNNNDPSNLVALSIKDHYDTHYAQGDWLACRKLAAKMRLSPEEISELARKNNQQQVLNGTHPWIKRSDGTSFASDRVKNGTHPWLGGSHQKRQQQKLIDTGTHHWQSIEHSAFVSQRELEKVENGTHPFLGAHMNKKMLAAGKHISQNKEFQKEFSILQRENSEKRLAAGTHNFFAINAYTWTCSVCGKIGKGKSNLERHQGGKACLRLLKKAIKN